ncbi:hypothetical protein D3C76_1568290 [compost metagenome]
MGAAAGGFSNGGFRQAETVQEGPDRSRFAGAGQGIARGCEKSGLGSESFAVRQKRIFLLAGAAAGCSAHARAVPSGQRVRRAVPQRKAGARTGRF